MKYLIVTGDLVRTGGMDRANFALADYITRQGHELHLVAHRVDLDLLNRAQVVWHSVTKPLNSYLLGEPLLDWAGRSQARKITDEGGKVLVNGGNCQWGGVNWVHYVHAAYRSYSATNSLYKLKARITHQLSLNSEIQSLKLAKVIIANSEKTKQDLIANLNIPAAKIKTIYYGCDPTELYPPTINQKLNFRQELGWAEKKLILVFIGGLGDRRKGFDTLFAAWQQLCADPQWDVDLKVIGRGVELDAWKLKAQPMGDRIEFMGFRQDVPNILRAADCLVAPTRYEAYGLGVQEAICCGLPAIVSANAGIAETYPPNLQELLLADPNDPQTLIHSLLLWRRNIPQYSELIKPFTQTLRSYTWDNMAEKIVEQLKY
jgi:glycosyltransferase involved in cell wall biosynthesis